jgi:Predicted membrane protein
VITLEFVNVLMGLMMAGIAIVNLRDRASAKRYNNAAFWGIYAVTFLAGSYVPNFVNGLFVIAMVLIVAVGKLGSAPAEQTSRAEREVSAAKWGNRLFIPALTIPAVALLGTFTLKGFHVNGVPLVDPRQVTLISLGLATVAALIVGMVMLRPPASAPIIEARRLMDAVSWAAALPQMLAALGAMFALAGVGPIVAGILARWIPLDTPFVVVATYTVGMALFTSIMGNAFAAFPVMTAAIGLPLIVHRFGGNVTIMAAVGMLSGFCGTLVTPMAANFNIVPAALLELPDQNGVIKVQIPTALMLLAANTAIMYLFAFR